MRSLKWKSVFPLSMDVLNTLPANLPIRFLYFHLWEHISAWLLALMGSSDVSSKTLGVILMGQWLLTANLMEIWPLVCKIQLVMNHCWSRRNFIRQWYKSKVRGSVKSLGIIPEGQCIPTTNFNGTLKCNCYNSSLKHDVLRTDRSTNGLIDDDCASREIYTSEVTN